MTTTVMTAHQDGPTARPWRCALKVVSVKAPASQDNGHTASLWSEWLNDPKSPIYRALLLRDKGLLADLLPSFNATGDGDWNDSEKLYSTLTKLIANDDFKQHVRPRLQHAMAQLLGALNAAAARLQPSLGPGVGRAVSRLNSASQLLYNGIHLTELKVKMKLGEYYALQCEHLRNLQRKAADAIDRTWGRPQGRVGQNRRRGPQGAQDRCAR